MAHYILTILLSYFVFVSLGHPVSFVILAIVFSITHNLQSTPTILPSEVGFMEPVMASRYIALLGPQTAAVSAAATVLIRVLWVWLRLPLGFIAVQWVMSRGLV